MLHQFIYLASTPIQKHIYIVHIINFQNSNSSVCSFVQCGCSKVNVKNVNYIVTLFNYMDQQYDEILLNMIQTVLLR